MKLIDAPLDCETIKSRLENPSLIRWLTEVQAFTLELKKHFQSIRIELLSQGPGPFYEDEQTLLAASHRDSEGIVRRVLIYADDIPVCYARVAISDDILEKQSVDFHTLGTKPLGETLFFGKDKAKRDRFRYFYLDDAPCLKKEMTSAYPSSERLYGRQSILANPNGEVLVTEVFLTHLPDLAESI